jgi:hypothetical protein
VTVSLASTIRRVSTLRLAPIHPEAADWSTRVVAQGASVSTATLANVSRLCYAIDAAGIRDRFLRLNVFSGTGLNAAITPLFRGRSLNGAQYGGTIDTNAGGASAFVSGDYSESVGLTAGLLTTKHLDTGFSTSLVTAAQWEAMHFSGWHGPLSSSNADPFIIGSFGSDRYGIQISIRSAALAYETGRAGRTATVLATPGVQGARPSAFLLNQRTSTVSQELYRNGSLEVTSATATTGILTSAFSFYVFAYNNSGTRAGDQPGTPLRHYSIGLAMTAAQVAAFHAAMLAFNTSMGRTS